MPRCYCLDAWLRGGAATVPPVDACLRPLSNVVGQSSPHGCSCARLLAACRSLASSRLLARVATFLLASLGRARPTTAHVRGSTLLGGARLWPLATCGSCSLLAPTNVTTGKQWWRPQTPIGVVGISWTTNKSSSARNTAVAFYPGVYRGVIYISAGKTVSEEI